MAEFASNGKANAALTTGIIGTAGVGLGLLNGGLGNILGGLGGWNTQRQTATDTAAIMAMSALAGRASADNGCTCNEDHKVDRYEAAQAARIAELETEVKLRDANTYTDQKLLEVYKYFDGKIGSLESADAAQAVTNQRIADSFEAVHTDIN